MKQKLRGIVLLMVLTLMIQGVSPVFATTTEIQDAKEEKSALESEKSAIEDKIQSLEAEKSDVLTYIQKLDKEVESLTLKINDTKSKITDLNKELKTTKAELKEAEETLDNQYITMKSRIKYMYENGNAEYVQLLLASDSVTDLLNRAEYVEKISDYDKNMLDRYVETKAGIEKTKAQIESDIAELSDLNDTLTADKEGVDKLIANKQSEIRKYNALINTSQEEASAYEEKIAEQEEIIEDLLEQERKRIEEEERRKEEERKKQEALQQQQAQNSGSNNSGNSSSKPSTNTSTGFRWPLNIGGTITSYFGYRNSPTAGASSYHKGIDVGAASGTPIVAAASGTVVSASYSSGAGNYVQIYHGNSTFTIYMHCSALAVSSGQTVSAGQVIGYVGSTGVSTGPHLHFGVSVNGSYVNPLNYVSKP